MSDAAPAETPAVPRAPARRKRKRRRETNYEAAVRVRKDNAMHSLRNVRMVAAVECGIAGVGFENGKAWPASCTSACWHCCHRFDGPPMGMPVKHDTFRDHITLRGCFCSFDCCKAHMRAEGGGPNRQSLWLLELVAMRLREKLRADGRPMPDGSYRGIRCAHPRTMLEMFGGKMGIEEFRKNASVMEEITTLEPFKTVSWKGIQIAMRGATISGSDLPTTRGETPLPPAPTSDTDQVPPSMPGPTKRAATLAPAIAVPTRTPKHRHKTLEHFMKKK